VVVAQGLAADAQGLFLGVGGAVQQAEFVEGGGDRLQQSGLDERLFCGILKCCSPAIVRQLLEDVIEDADSAPGDLRVLDLGAGNGMVGEELAELGAQTILGVDILEAAAAAAKRDRPDVYEEYVVADMAHLSERQSAWLGTFDFNCLTCVAALGFGDIPPDAFTEAYNLVETGGLVAFNIKEEFLNGKDTSGFSELIKAMCDDGTVDVKKRVRYQHRLSISGEPLYYVAMVGAKRSNIDG
jgi:predicted TPR repeat methyltransferase